MIKVKKLYSDRHFEIYAIENNDKCFFESFVKNLQKSDTKKIVKLFENTAKNGLPKNKEKFKKLYCGEMDVCEFKSKPYRFLCALDGKRSIIISHCFEKTKRGQTEGEINKAVKLFKQYFGEKQDGKSR